MEKLVLVINGKGGVGKDTMCLAAAQKYRVRNVSSITPIKELARLCGWNGEKDDASRRFLADLKALTVRYNDYPTTYILRQYRDFLLSDDEILFVHIREPEEIKKFVTATENRAKTLLVRAAGRMGERVYGNAADDDTERYPYDYVFDNDGTAEEGGARFCAFLGTLLS